MSLEWVLTGIFKVRIIHKLKLIDMLYAPRLLTNRQFQWTGNGHSQLPLAELGKLSPNIDLLRATGSNRRTHTYTDTTERIIAPATWSIKTGLD